MFSSRLFYSYQNHSAQSEENPTLPHKSHKSHKSESNADNKMTDSCCHKNEPCHKEEESSSHSHAHTDHAHKHDEKESHGDDCCAHDHSHDEHAHKHAEKDSHEEEEDCCAHGTCAKEETAEKETHNHHEHSHDHDEDCSHCGPKVTSADDVADVDIPEWKKKALAAGGDASAAPFGMSWNTEGTVSATAASETVESKTHDHDHGHS